MTIESNNLKLNLTEVKGVSIGSTADGISAPEKPKIIFKGMSQNDADYCGLRVEYNDANNDYQGKQPEIINGANTDDDALQFNMLYPNVTIADIQKIKLEHVRKDLLENFKKYNKDGDEKLSWEEYENYATVIYTRTPEILMKHEKEILKLQENGTCKSRKEAVEHIAKTQAKNFIAGAEQVLTVLDYDPNKVDWDNVQAISIPKTDEEWKVFEQKLNEIKNMVQSSFSDLTPGMTRKEAEELDKTKPGTLAKFNAICPEGKDVLDKTDFLKGSKKLLAASGISIEGIIKAINQSDKETRLRFEQTLITIMTGNNEDMILEEYKEIKTVDELASQLCISDDEEMQEKWKTMSPQEKGEILGKKLREKLMDSLDISNALNEVQFEMQKMKLGELNSLLKTKGLTPDKLKEMSEEERYKLAQEIVVNKYLATVSHLVKSMSDDKDIQSITASLYNALNEAPVVRDLLRTIGIQRIENDEIRQETIATVLKQTPEIETNSIAGSVLVSEILRSGNEENITALISNNPDLIPVYESIIASMPENERNTISAKLDSAITQYVNSGGQINTSANNNGQTAPGNGSLQNVDNPTGYTPVTYSVSETKAMSSELLKNNGITDISTEQQSVNQASFKLKNEMAIQQKLRYAQARIKNMSKSRVFELVAKHFDQIPDQYKDQVINYFKQMPTQVLVETMIGNEDIQNFMFEHKFVKFDDLVTYVRKHPHLVSNGNNEMSDSLKEKLQEYVKDNKIDDVEVETNAT